MDFSDLSYRLQIGALSLIVIILALAAMATLFYLLLVWLRTRQREEKSLSRVLFQVAVPRDNEIKIDAAEQMFASLYAIYQGGLGNLWRSQEHLTFEIVGTKEDVRFYISAPENLADLVEKQIHGAYPGADIREVEEYNIFSKDGQVAFAQLKLKATSYYPLRLYKELPTDPLSSITSVLAKMDKNEGAAVAILISPANDSWRQSGRSYISKVKRQEAKPETAVYQVDAKTLEAIDNKCGKPGFKTVIRFVVSAKNKTMAQMHLDNLLGVFSQFSSNLNGLVKAGILIKKFFMIDFIYRYFPVFGVSSVLNSEELAGIFHLPNKFVETPHIYWLSAKRAPAPAEIAQSGLYLGQSLYRGITRPVFMQGDDRRRHIYIIGKTGVGKSELMKQMILQDIRAGKGVCFIDPHDTIEKMLPLIPPERVEDVIYFDPSNTQRPMGLNMLEADSEEQQHFVVTSIIGLMYKLYDPHQTGIIGPRFEHAIRNAMLTVMSEPGNTFVEVVRALTDSQFVQELLPKVKDPIVRRYWTDQIAKTADFHKSEVLDYIVSKFGRFVTNKMMRNIIGQSQSAFNFRRVMDEGKILLINLAKGKIGEENSSFLGLVLVPKILIAAMSRQDTPEEKRRDFFLYVDEFQNFATPDFAQILSEARKYRLDLCVANQFIGQMEEDVKNAVFGNVGTLIAFRVGVTDANYLQHEFSPTFNETDLINIDRYNAYVRTIVNMKTVPAFSMDLTRDLSLEEKEKNQRVAELIKRLSSLKYGRAREVVEAEVAKRARL